MEPAAKCAREGDFVDFGLRGGAAVDTVAQGANNEDIPRGTFSVAAEAREQTMKRDDSAWRGRRQEPSRREFLHWGGKLAAASALAGVAIPHVHAGENNTIRLAIVGCGGRGSGAVGNAMRPPADPSN